MLYIAQVVTYTGILWLLYMLLLRNKPMHAFNRGYLLMATVLPVLLPLIKLPQTVPQHIGYSATIIRLPEFAVVKGAAMPVTVNYTIAWSAVVYGAVAFIALLVATARCLQIRKLVKRSESVELDGYTLLQHTGYGPGSWGRYIFLPGANADDAIIRHEVAHVRLHHSSDIMLLTVMQCLLWPNIFLYAIKNELRQVHEFQADVVAGTDIASYSRLLLASVFNTCTVPFAHSFSIHPIKRRIMMLNKKRNKTIGVAAGIIAVLAAGAVLFNVVMLQSCKPKKWNITTATKVDKLASFNGDLYEYMSQNTRYPQDFINKGIDAHATISFIVDADGRVIDPQVKESTDTSLSTVGLQLVSKMPKWIPAEKDGKPIASEMSVPMDIKFGGGPYEIPMTTMPQGMDYKLENKNSDVVISITDENVGSLANGFWSKVIHGSNAIDDMQTKVDVTPDAVGVDGKTYTCNWVRTKINGKPAATITLDHVFAGSDIRKAFGVIATNGEKLVFKVSY